MIELEPLDHIIENVNHIPASSKRYGYTWATRCNRNAPWLATIHFFTSGSTCRARALDYLLINGYTENENCKMFDDVTWLRIQTQRHLKQVGIK